MKKKRLYLAFPVCMVFLKDNLDQMTDDELFDTFCKSFDTMDDMFCYKDIKSMLKDLNCGVFESTSWWMYAIDVDYEKYNKWLYN